MSRVGNAPIEVPDGVTVKVDGSDVEVTGPKGTLNQRVPEPIMVRTDGPLLVVERPDDSRQAKALHGLSRTLLANMVLGVTEGFTRELEIVGVGYRANAQGNDKVQLTLGFSHPVEVSAPEGVTFEVPQPTQIIVSGIDKQKVGQTAANIRALRKPEPYKGKGVRYLGEHVIRKAGKAAK
ncbi:MAG: 50S ribosomal protein L6 [Acidobacteria bacterium]|nr:50S ribosomal protein L6 [Acidobacteriota bacterium]